MIVGHVHLSATQWITVALVSWLGALPFAAIGLVIGYVAKPDSVQPITGLSTMLIAAFGGLWLPVDQMPSLMKHIAQLTPAYWTGLSSRSALSQSGLDTHAVAGGAGLDRRPRFHRPAPLPRRHRAGLSTERLA